MKTETDKCLQCPIAGICNSNIAETDVPEKVRLKAVALTLGVPLMLMLTALAGIWLATGSQLWSALAALAVPALYYPAFYLIHRLQCY